MTRLLSTLLVTSAALVTASVLPSQPSSKGYAQFDITKTPKTDSDNIKINSDQGKAISVSLDNKDYYYQIVLGIGSPPQNVQFTIDTGSSDLWVMKDSNPYCTKNPFNRTGISCDGSLFRPENSPSFKDLNQTFNIKYGDGTAAEGTLVRDFVTIGDIQLANATFALADVVNSSTCVFGIGFPGNEASARAFNESGFFPTYFNIPSLMKKQGYIYTNSYSLWLDETDSTQGIILFGAVDTAKYQGDNISLLPIYNLHEEITDHPTQLTVLMHGMSANNQSFVECAMPVLLDSGTSYSYLPKKIVDAIGNAIGFTYYADAGLYIGPRDQALERIEDIQVNFHGVILNIPMKDLIVPLTYDDDTDVFVSNEAQSILAIGYAEDIASNILGDVFLRSMYTVVDLDHYQIGVAQARNKVKESNIVPIIANIPGAVPAPDYKNMRASREIELSGLHLLS